MDKSKFTYELWVALGEETRQIFLEKHSTEEIFKLLSNIHPKLRVANLNDIEWRDYIQSGYETGKEIQKMEDSNIETLRSEVSSNNGSRTNIQSTSQKIKEQDEYGTHIQTTIPSQATLRITRQDRTFEQIVTHEGYVANPGYDIYNVLRDFDGSIIRLFIQPIDDKNPNAYKECITHFLTSNDSLLFEKYPSSYISVTFNCEVEKGTREFTFKKLSSDNDLENMLNTIYNNTVNSDIYWAITYNVSGIYVNIVTPYGGGGIVEEQNTNRYYIENKMSTTYPNSCFYRCVRKIRDAIGKDYINKKQTYAQMRTALTGSTEDSIVNISLMPIAEEVFGIKFIVLGSKEPKIHLRGYNTDGTFNNTKVKYTIIYDDVYKSDIDEIVEYSENPAVFHNNRSCALIEKVSISGTDIEYYGIMVLEKSHYHLVKNLIRPIICERCGSRKHTIDMSNKNENTRSDCIQNIANVLNDEELIKWSSNTHIIVYDFETINDKRLVPYSVSWAVDDQEIKHTTAIHIETQFIDNIRSIKGEKILVAYFGSCFDGYFLLDAIVSKGIKLDSMNTIVHRGKILRMKIGNMRTWDLAQFTKCSLQDACKNFEINMTKLEYDFNKIQTLYDEHKTNFLEHLDLEKTREYNNMDVAMTRELLKVVRNVLMELTQIDPLSCVTLNELVYKMLKRDWVSRNIVVNKMSLEYDDIFSSIPAGRCEAIEKGILEGDYVLIDKNSLYPYVCLTNEFPNGKYVDTIWNQEISDVYPIYLAECELDQSRLKRKYAGIKTEKGVDWNKDNVVVWLWKEEIEYLKQRKDVNINIGRTIAWVDLVKPFEALKIFLEKRIEEENKSVPNRAIISMCKIGFNGATGKMIQKNIDDIWTYVSSASDVYRFVKKYGCAGVMKTAVNGKYVFVGHKESGNYIRKPRHWGCRIYGLSHLEMYKDLDNIETMVYGDTDSAIIKKSEIPKIKLGKEIGKYKIEHDAKKIIIIGKKSYCMIGDKIRYRLKGYKDGQEWEIRKKEDGEVIKKGKNISEEMFEGLASEKYEVYTYQENLVKESIRKVANDKYEMFTIKHMRIEKKLT